MATNNNKKELKKEVVISYRDFTNDDGEIISYLSIELPIGGEKIRLAPKSEDKRLLSFLLKDEGLTTVKPDSQKGELTPF